MKIITGDRMSGKTTALIKQAAERGAYIVCADQKEAARIHEESRRLGLNIPLPITYSDFEDRRYYGKGCELMIDNAEALVNYLSRFRVVACTVNTDSETTHYLTRVN